MLVAYTSDLHIDITDNNWKLLNYLIDHINSIKPDIFIIAGDISNTLKNLDTALKILNKIECIKIMIPGNHDIWIESNNQLKKGFDSFYKYRQAIKELCENNNFVCPIYEPYVLNHCAIIGNIGWYDYSLRDRRLDTIYNTHDYDKGHFDDAVWNDVRYAIFLKSPGAANWRDRTVRYKNSEVFLIFFNELKEIYNKVPENIQNIIFILHTAPFKECIAEKNIPYPFDAYEGSQIIGDYIKTIAKQKDIKIICGHKHNKLYLEIDNISIYRSPVGYLHSNDLDFEHVARDVIGTFSM